MSRPHMRCMGCRAPIQFQPGAGSRLCPFCGYINLVREQRVAVPTIELRTDEIFALMQRGNLEEAQRQADDLIGAGIESYRLAFYRACVMFESGKVTEAVYTLIDLTGMEAPKQLRADTQALLAEALFAAERDEEALEATVRCLGLYENHPGALHTKAKILIEAGKIPEAIQVLEECIPTLSRRWKITFPPRPSSLLILLARCYIKAGRPGKSLVPLENLLLQDTAASLPTVAEAISLLGISYIETRPDREEGLALVRQAALLDPQNRMGLLTNLQTAIEKGGGDADAELGGLAEKRAEVLAEIRQVFRIADITVDDGGNADALPAETSLRSLDQDSDRRTDLLESSAHRLDLSYFDRGTLYPLQSLEDFRRWVVAWRARDYIRLLKHSRLEESRITRLKAAHEFQQGRASFHRQRERLQRKRGSRRHGKLRWIMLGIAGLALMGLVFLTVFGDRLLDSFEGRLVRIECRGNGNGPPCTLYVATDRAGVKRYRRRTSSNSPLTRLVSSWLDQRVQKDGLLSYPLDFPWGDIPADSFTSCRGKQVFKEKFSFSPRCK